MNMFMKSLIVAFISFSAVACASAPRPQPRTIEILEVTHRECVDYGESAVMALGGCDEFVEAPAPMPMLDLSFAPAPAATPVFPWYGKLAAAGACALPGALGGYEAARAIQKGQQTGPTFSYSTQTEIIGASVGGGLSALACWGVTEAIESLVVGGK